MLQQGAVRISRALENKEEEKTALVQDNLKYKAVGGKGEWSSERDRQTETETETETDKQTETETQTDRQRQTKTEREGERQRQRQTKTETDRQTDRQTDRDRPCAFDRTVIELLTFMCTACTHYYHCTYLIFPTCTFRQKKA